MIYQGIEFFNVDHLEAVPGISGLRLERFPHSFSQTLGVAANTNARFRSRRPHGCELRFVTTGNYFDIALTGIEDEIAVTIYYGDRFHSLKKLEPGKLSVFHIEKPEIYNVVEEEKLQTHRFANYVWRIQFGMGGYACFNYLDTYGHEHRPPEPGEKPDFLLAAYGSSITCGSVVTAYSNCYVNQTAVQLGIDIMNKGLSGSSFCEKEIADYLAASEVDGLSLELGVNMIMFFSPDEFRQRIRYLLNKINADGKAKKVFVIDMFPNKGKIFKDQSHPYYLNYRAFKAILREELRAMPKDRFIAIKGEDILLNDTYLSVDLLHPADDGHIKMGQNLAKLMEAHL